MPEPKDFRLRLRLERNPVPAAARLKRLLKLALRSFGFPCVQVEEVPPDGPQPTPFPGRGRSGLMRRVGHSMRGIRC
jgi:hypothetical protein